MYWDVVEVQGEPDWTLVLRFADGLAGRVRLPQDLFTGVLTPLLDPAVFSRVFVDHGAVAWPGEIDLAPETLYEQVRRQSPSAQLQSTVT